MILLTLSRGKGEETVRLQLPASPAEIGETFAFLDRISLDTTATAILDVSSNVLCKRTIATKQLQLEIEKHRLSF